MMARVSRAVGGYDFARALTKQPAVFAHGMYHEGTWTHLPADRRAVSDDSSADSALLEPSSFVPYARDSPSSARVNCGFLASLTQLAAPSWLSSLPCPKVPSIALLRRSPLTRFPPFTAILVLCFRGRCDDDGWLLSTRGRRS